MPAVAEITKAIRGIGKKSTFFTKEAMAFFKELFSFLGEKGPKGDILTPEGSAVLERLGKQFFSHASHITDIFLVQFARSLKLVLPGHQAELTQLMRDVLPALKSGHPEAAEQAFKNLQGFFKTLKPAEQHRLQLFVNQLSHHLEADTAPVARTMVGRLKGNTYEQILANKMNAAAREVDLLIGTADKAARNATRAVRAVEEVVDKVTGKMTGLATALRSNKPRSNALNWAADMLGGVHGLPSPRSYADRAQTLHTLLTDRHGISVTVEEVEQALRGKLKDPSKLRMIQEHTAHMLDEGVSQVRELRLHVDGMLRHNGVMTSSHYQQLSNGLHAFDRLSTIAGNGAPLRETGVLKHHRQLIAMAADPVAYVTAAHGQRESITRGTASAVARLAVQKGQAAAEAVVHH